MSADPNADPRSRTPPHSRSDAQTPAAAERGAEPETSPSSGALRSDRDTASGLQPPEVLGRRVLYQGNVGAFGLHEVRFANGHLDVLPLLEHPGASAVVPFLAPDRIVLLRQYRLAASGTLWEIPAGKLDAGEDPTTCAHRELREETGFRAGRMLETGSILTAPGFTDERIHLFCAFDLTAGETAQEPNEQIEVHEVSLAHAFEMIADGEIVDAKTVTGLLHARRILDTRR